MGVVIFGYVRPHAKDWPWTGTVFLVFLGLVKAERMTDRLPSLLSGVSALASQSIRQVVPPQSLGGLGAASTQPVSLVRLTFVSPSIPVAGQAVAARLKRPSLVLALLAAATVLPSSHAALLAW